MLCVCVHVQIYLYIHCLFNMNFSTVTRNGISLSCRSGGCKYATVAILKIFFIFIFSKYSLGFSLFPTLIHLLTLLFSLLAYVCAVCGVSRNFRCICACNAFGVYVCMCVECMVVNADACFSFFYFLLVKGESWIGF